MQAPFPWYCTSRHLIEYKKNKYSNNLPPHAAFASTVDLCSLYNTNKLYSITFYIEIQLKLITIFMLVQN